MIKRYVVFSLIMFGGIPLNAAAQTACETGTQVTDATNPTLTVLLSGNTVCAQRNGDRWQEEHKTNSELWDYKKGPTDPVDPSKQLGTWAITDNQVTYTYTAFGAPESYSFQVYDLGNGSYNFCSVVNDPQENIIGATIQSDPQCP